MYVYFFQDKHKSGQDYKASQRYADFMKDDNEGVSDFARKKSIKEQREYLPIYAVRQEVRKYGNGLYIYLNIIYFVALD